MRGVDRCEQSLVRSSRIAILFVVGALFATGTVRGEPTLLASQGSLDCPDLHAQADRRLGADLRAFYPRGERELDCVDPGRVYGLDRDGLCLVMDSHGTILAKGYFAEGRRVGHWIEREGTRYRERDVEGDSTVLECDGDSCGVLDLGHTQPVVFSGFWPSGRVTLTTATSEPGVPNLKIEIAQHLIVEARHHYVLPSKSTLVLVPLGALGSAEFMTRAELFAYRRGWNVKTRYRN